MRRPPRPQYKYRDDNNGDDNNDHSWAVETNAGESDGADKIKVADIEESDEIEEM